jgi:thymidylate synthase (FAD)
MKIIDAKVEIIDKLDGLEMLKKIELIGRTCYKSEDKITDDSCKQFVKNIIARGHESVLEHVNFSVRFTCDRGVSHEIVRHRIASYSQESTRYCNYSKGDFNGEITVIKPCFLVPGTAGYDMWYMACQAAEQYYFSMLNWGCSPQEARAILPNSLKTELVMTANIREWRHFLKLRTSKAAHPQMREIAIILLNMLIEIVPELFGDIKPLS